MNQYYLMSQLPSLDSVSETMPLPITEERFFELCGRFLSKSARKSLDELTLVPSREGIAATNNLIDGWNRAERFLRLALGKARAEKMNKKFDAGDEQIPIEFLQIAKQAIEAENPLEAEKYLCRERLAFLESLRPIDSFSEDAVFYYAIKLKLLSRMQCFDETIGSKAYKDAYNSILDRDKQETK